MTAGDINQMLRECVGWWWENGHTELFNTVGSHSHLFRNTDK